MSLLSPNTSSRGTASILGLDALQRVRAEGSQSELTSAPVSRLKAPTIEGLSAAQNPKSPTRLIDKILPLHEEFDVPDSLAAPKYPPQTLQITPV